MNNFWNGFEKRGLQDTKAKELALAGVLGSVVPLGTTIHSAASDRPKEHSRLGEWATRVGLGLGGGLLGHALTPKKTLNMHLHPDTPPLQMHVPTSAAPTIIGRGLGSALGSGLSVGHYYDDKGKLKAQYRK